MCRDFRQIAEKKSAAGTRQRRFHSIHSIRNMAVHKVPTIFIFSVDMRIKIFSIRRE